MKITFNNEKELLVDYFSVADGMLLAKSQWDEKENILNLFKDPLASSVMVYENEDGDEYTYEGYTQFEEVREDKNGAITVIMSKDGQGTIERLMTLEGEMKQTQANVEQAQNDIETLKETGGADVEAYTSVLALAKMEAQKITDDTQALAVKELFDEWSGEGVEYAEGKYIRYGILLYKVIKAHTSQADWTPDTAHSLFTPVGEPDAGTKDNPIVWVSGMESEKDKYYTDEGVLYIGLEDSKIGLSGQPKNLPRYFKAVEEV